MLAEDVRVLFTGFEPTTDLRSGVKFLLDDLSQKVPSRSFLTLTLCLTNGLFEGVIAVTSTAETFVARATDPRGAVEVAQLLGERLVDQLNRWKTLRFNP